MGHNSRDYRLLYEVKHRNAVPHRAQDRTSIGSEYDVSLPINGAAKVRKLCDWFIPGEGKIRVAQYLEVGFHRIRSMLPEQKKNKYG